jgi:hypothetical protein
MADHDSSPKALMSDDRLIHKRAGHSDKVNKLTDFEELVWRYYMTSADDFGVMRFSSISLQADSDRMLARSAMEIQTALCAVRDVGLIDTFTHQGREYCYQWDWQDWQSLRYPRQPVNPMPPPEKLATCSEATRRLFLQHKGNSGGRGGASGGTPPTDNTPSALDLPDSGNISETLPEDSRDIAATPPQDYGKISDTRARARPLASSVSVSVSHQSLASGQPLGLDEMFESLRNDYPEHRRQDSVLIRQAFIRAFDGLKNGQREGLYVEMRTALAAHKQSEQWQDGKIPNFGKWIEEKRWIQVLPPTGARPASGRTAVTPRKYSGVAKGDRS